MIQKKTCRTKIYTLLFVLFMLLLGVALAQRWCLPHASFLAPDSSGYILPGMEWASGGKFMPTQGRNFLYPLFAGVCMKLFSSLYSVALMQHGITLLAAGLFFFVWLRKAGRSWGVALLFIHGLVGLLFLSILLLFQHNVWFQHYMGPESLFSALVLLLFSIVLLIPQKESSSWIWGGWFALIIFVHMVILQIMPKWGFSFPLGLLLLFVTCRLLRKHGKACLVLGSVALALGFLSFMLPNARLQQKYDHEGSTFLMKHVFFFHYDLMEDGLKACKPEGRSDEAYQQLLKGLNRGYQSELKRAETEGLPAFKKYSYNPDKLIYGPAQNELHAFFGSDADAYNAFCRKAFIQAVLHHPFLYLQKVLEQLSIAYHFPANLYAPQTKAKWNTPARYAEDSLRIVDRFPKRIQEDEIFIQARAGIVATYAGDTRASVFTPFGWRKLNGVVKGLNFLYLPSLLLFMGGSIFMRRTLFVQGELWPIFLLVLVAYMAGFGLNLTVAMTHALEFDRYLHFQTIINIISEVGGLWVLLLGFVSMKKQKVL